MMQASMDDHDVMLSASSSSPTSCIQCSRRCKRTLLLSASLFVSVCFLDFAFLRVSPINITVPWNSRSDDDNDSSLLRGSTNSRPTFGGAPSTSSTPMAPLSETGRRKPKFILHIGPPKTGTTTLQTELTAWSEYLALDNYVYKGREYHPTISTVTGEVKMNPMIPDLVKNLWQTCSPEYFPSALSSQQQQNNHNSSTATATPDLSTVFDDIKKELEPFRSLGTNVIVSDEVLSKAFAHADCYKNLVSYLGGADENDGWDVQVVANYRRIFEWVPSSKFQQERAKMDWPGPGPNSGGWSIGPLFPDVLEQQKDHYYRGYYFTDYVVDKVNHTMPVTVLSMYDGDLLSNFLCGDALQGTAPHSCEASLSSELRQAAEDENRNMRAPDQGNILYYDALALAALQRGWIDRSAWHRWQVKDMVQDYTTHTLNKTALDFPQVCPSQKELQEFLEGSLQVERKVYPVTVAKAMEQEHRQKFWFLAEKTTTYCWIDIDATLQDPVWREFFTQFR